MINRFILNEVSYFGPGAREVLPKEISRLGLHKAFVATDKDLIKFGVADKVLKVLEAAKIPYEIFSEIKPNPTVSNVKAGCRGICIFRCRLYFGYRWRIFYGYGKGDWYYFQ